MKHNDGHVDNVHDYLTRMLDADEVMANAETDGNRRRRLRLEIEAKRTIMTRHQPLNADGTGSCRGCGQTAQENPVTPHIDECPDLFALAEIYLKMGDK